MADRELFIVEVLFWLSVLLLAFTFIGYSLLIRVWASCRNQCLSKTDDVSSMRISFLLVAADEEARVIPRIKNLMDTEWPQEQMEVILVSDGCSDNTVSLVHKVFSHDARVKVIELTPRQGKANGLNHGVAAASGEIIVLADARQHFEKQTVPLLLRAFSDPKVGAVSGRLVVDGGDSAVGQGVGSYWKMETLLRSAEAQVDSCIGCTGAVYALRKNLYQPIPADTLLDDVVIPMQIALAGSRVLYEPAALAHDPQDLDQDREQIRKRRTLAGNFQMLFRYPTWLLPWKNRLWLQLVAHKYLRLTGPVLLFGILSANMMLMANAFYRVCLYAQVLLYGLAVIGLMASRFKIKIRIISLPAAFLFLNWMIIRGFLHYLNAPRSGAWEMTKKTSMTT